MQRILLIEDEEFLAACFREMLSNFKENTFEVRWAPRLQAGLELLGAEEFDLVLLDLNLPDSQGIATVQAVFAQAPDATVVLLTGVDDMTIATQAIQAGAQDYLVKGQFDSRQLFRSLHYALERRRILADMQQQHDDLLAVRAELEKAYYNLKESQAQVFQQEKMASVGQLAAGVAHEINNPIGYITSNLNMLDKFTERLKTFVELQDHALKAGASPDILKDLAEKRREMKIDFALSDVHNLIKESLEGAERVGVIVRDLKGFACKDQGRQKAVDLNELLESTVNIVWNELKYKATLFREYGALPTVRCFYQQMSQVFMNILVNAVQAIEKQGVITIRTWEKGDTVFVSIRDNGCGIPREKLNHIFEPFFTTKEVGSGTGLGLSIVYDIVVKKHGGEIAVESEVGRGTVFTVSIPISGTEEGGEPGEQ